MRMQRLTKFSITQRLMASRTRHLMAIMIPITFGGMTIHFLIENHPLSRVMIVAITILAVCRDIFSGRICKANRLNRCRTQDFRGKD